MQTRQSGSGAPAGSGSGLWRRSAYGSPERWRALSASSFPQVAGVAPFAFRIKAPAGDFCTDRDRFPLGAVNATGFADTTSARGRADTPGDTAADV
jgi:hypothetical protein